MTVTQLQYTAWPDHDVPKSATPLIEISRTLKSLQGNGKQQILIHCRSVMSVLLNNNIKVTCTSIFLDWEVMFLILFNQSCKKISQTVLLNCSWTFCNFHVGFLWEVPLIALVYIHNYVLSAWNTISSPTSFRNVSA